jgi:hypothetical protein
MEVLYYSSSGRDATQEGGYRAQDIAVMACKQPDSLLGTARVATKLHPSFDPTKRGAISRGRNRVLFPACAHLTEADLAQARDRHAVPEF